MIRGEKNLYPWQTARLLVFDETRKTFGRRSHATKPARGGSVSRRYARGALSAERATHTRRLHGAPRSSNGLGMRPPGCGIVEYQNPKIMARPYADGFTPIVSGSADDIVLPAAPTTDEAETVSI